MLFFSTRRSTNDSFPKIPGLSALLLGGAVLLAGCHPAAVTDPNDSKFVVAEKGNWVVLEGDLDKEVGDYLKQHQATVEQVGPAKMPMLKTAMLRNMVLKKLLLEKAATLQLKDEDVDKEVTAQLDQLRGGGTDAEFQQQLQKAGLSLDDLKARLREKVLVEKVLHAEAFQNVEPTDQEINAIYLKNKDSFNLPEKIRASRVLILVDDKMSPAEKAAKKKVIDAARARVAKGEDFSKVAMEVSEDKYSAPKGGDINFFARNENEPGFDDVAFKTKVGTVSPVFQTALGYQFLKVTDVHPAGAASVSDARGYISSKLREMKMAQEEQAYAKKVLADSNVVYHMVLVDPPAQAAGPDGQGPPPDNAPPSSEPSNASAPPPAPTAPAPAANGSSPQ